MGRVSRRGPPTEASGAIPVNGPGEQFLTTRWTLVLKARAEAFDSGAALAELCEAYYAPVHAFIRASVGDPESARDLTQEFFSRVLRGGAFDRAEPARGQFRSFLLGAVKHFLADMRDRERAAKRGGSAESVPLEAISGTSPGFEPAVPGTSVNDALFDREWAIALLDRALLELAAALAGAGKSEHFAVLKPWLTGASTIPPAEAAARLGMNENSLSVAIHRLRKRFREIVQVEIAQTVTGADEQQAELRHLISALSIAATAGPPSAASSLESDRPQSAAPIS